MTMFNTQMGEVSSIETAFLTSIGLLVSLNIGYMISEMVRSCKKKLRLKALEKQKKEAMEEKKNKKD